MGHAVWLKNGDLLESVTNGAASWTSAADATSDIGVYAVTGRGLASDSGNYRFSFAQAAASATALSITPRALTVPADTLIRLSFSAHPPLTSRIFRLGLVSVFFLSCPLLSLSPPSSFPLLFSFFPSLLSSSFFLFFFFF